jgi:hypothetical protein
MRRFSAVLLATAAMSFGSIQRGSAADMGLPPVKAAPVVGPAPWSWTGFYIGGNVGAGWGTTETTADIGATVAPFITPATLAFQLPLSSQTVKWLSGWRSGRLELANWGIGLRCRGRCRMGKPEGLGTLFVDPPVQRQSQLAG